MATKRVLCLTHSHFHDPRTGITFHETIVPSREDDAPDGSKMWLGVAEDVPVETVAEFYARHPSFEVEGYGKALEDALAELEEGGASTETPPSAPTDEAAAAQAEKDADPGDGPPPETDATAAAAEGEGEGEAGEAEKTEGEEGPALADQVEFASGHTASLAEELNLEPGDFEGESPTSKGGFNAKDVRRIHGAKAG